MPISKSLSSSLIASYGLSALLLLLILRQGLVGALFAGLLVYSMVHLLSPLLEKYISGRRARLVSVAALGTLVISGLTLSIWGLVVFLQSDAGNLQVLLGKLADILEASRGQVPQWLREHLPVDAEAMRSALSNWLREHAGEAKLVGEEVARAIAQILIGMIIGALVALHDVQADADWRPLAGALRERVGHLSQAFQNIVFAQVRIAGINAVLTGIYLVVILPLSGIHLPLTKTLIVITFVAGLLPVLGNLISNTVLVLVCLSHSLQVAVASLLFMVVIHKLEYFLNARIIGSHIQARTWELLVAMLVMEATFGLPGLIAAPVMYAYLKRELRARKLV